MEDIVVSISCITFNHAKFIRECLDGFMMQQTSFPFEVLIHDDASTDGTQDIIREYQRKYPDIIKPILQKENQWSKGARGISRKYNFPRAKGKYIAMCEGDDYWTDPLKLQKQVDFLEDNPKYVLIYHNVKYNINGEEKILAHHKNKTAAKETSLYDISKINYINTPSVLFRNVGINFPESLKIGNIGDYPLWLLLAQKGKIYFLPDFMAVYRYGVGVQSSLSNIMKLETTNKMLTGLIDYFTDDHIVSENLKTQLQNNLIRIKKFKQKELPLYKIYYKLTDSMVYYFNKFFIDGKRN